MPADNVSKENMDQEAAESLLPHNVDELPLHKEYRSNPFLRTNAHLILAWALNVLLLAVLAFSNIHIKSNHSGHEGSPDTRVSDFGPARHLIETREVLFVGGANRGENGSFYIPHPSEVRYVGLPDEELDKNWEELVGRRYFRITADEARATWPDDYQAAWYPHRGGYIAGLDMFHTLHCLNELRMYLHPEYYKQQENRMQEQVTVHEEHCVDQIRQYIMCHGDLTPVPTRYYASVGDNYVMSDVRHTCRNFEKIREWVDQRHAVDGGAWVD